jgi:cardiolipin synthase A/B
MFNLWPSALTDVPILGWYLLAFNILAAAFIIFYEKQEPEKTVSWLLVLFALPGVGFLAYLILGRNQRKRKFQGKRVRDRCSADAADRQLEYIRTQPGLGPRQQELLRLGFASTCLPSSADNRVQILSNGEQKFGALLAAIRAARHHIHLEYFIWQADQIGREIDRKSVV